MYCKQTKLSDDILDFPKAYKLEALEVKFGKALRAILRGDARRATSNSKEKALRHIADFARTLNPGMDRAAVQ